MYFFCVPFGCYNRTYTGSPLDDLPIAQDSDPVPIPRDDVVAYCVGADVPANVNPHLVSLGKAARIQPDVVTLDEIAAAARIFDPDRLNRVCHEAESPDRAVG